MKLLAIACLVAVAYAYPSRLGEEKCTYGPSYWCENYKQAIECKAIEHCRKYVWKPKEADDCDQCKAAVAKFHTFVVNNSSKVLEILKNICNGLSVGSAQCKGAVSLYGEQIVAALTELSSDAEKLCQELEMCSSGSNAEIIKEIFIKKLKTNLHIIHMKSVRNDACEDCKLAFGEIKDILQDQDMQKEIITLVEALCSELGSLASQCKSYVDQYLPLVLDELASFIDPTQICDELGLCNSTKKAADIAKALDILLPEREKLLIPIMPGPVILTPPEKEEKSNDDKCDSCKDAIKQLNSYLTNNSTQVLEILKNMCALLGAMSSQCKLTVDMFGKQIIETLKNLTSDADKVCKELGMCSASQKDQIMKKLLVTNLKSDPYILALKSSKGDYCNDCKLVFAEIKDFLADASVKQEITNLLESVCSKLGSFADQCKMYVDAFLPLVLEELAALDDPTEICTELGLCNSTKKAVRIIEAVGLQPAQKKTEKNEIKNAKSPKAGPECFICEFAMRELDSILGDNATKEEIEAALDKVCSLLPSAIKAECDAFVQEYGPMIIKLLLQQLQPDQICTELGLCSFQGKSVGFSLKKPTDATCDLCKLAMNYLENILKSNATEEEIKQALEEICNMLPASLKTECDAIVEEYGDLIIQIILGEITPEEVCELLKLCTESKKLPIKDECALGESYWCASYKNALKCDALKQCNYLA